MILYHGSDIVVSKPDILHSKKHLDFGVGFYTTTVSGQAERWAKRKAVLNGREQGYVSKYELNDLSGFRVLDFGDDLEQWIDFVCECRDGADIYTQYDVITGKVADDKVIRVVDMYKRGIWDRHRAIQEIKVYDTYDQIVFVSMNAIDNLISFIGYYGVLI